MRVLKKELWPHKVRLELAESNVRMTDVENWVGNRMGRLKGKWNVVYHNTGSYFYFKRGKDATMFSLMWSGK